MGTEGVLGLEQFDVLRLSAEQIIETAPTIAVERMRSLVSAAAPLAPFQHRLLEELQLRFLANAAVAANLLGKSKAPDIFETLQPYVSGENVSLPSCVTHSCGLSHMEIGRSLFLIAPSAQTSPEPEALINALNGLVADHTGKRYWILDMSACTKIEPSLVAYLLGFQHSLRGGSKLLLLWLRQDSVPEALLPAMTKSFRVRARGAFLLSEEPNA
ncbi:MAG: hypothetical protein K1X79_05485 [Oligoflexia bacterium]|nr:hypothetical protein [Oligoflexia bacterium]